MPSRGQEIFDQRLEYPLPKQAGVRDYVFYFVPAGDGYGREARYFFGRFYRNHVAREVASLEALVLSLHGDLTSGVQRIREIVMVAHGNPQGLLVPVLNGVTATQRREFRYTTFESLAFLQRDLLDGKLPGLKQKRARVIEGLGTDSWITLRACRFGLSDDGMYALYSFFGGRPNLYCPREYQFFGTQPIVEGYRIPTKLAAHRHLVRQRFIPKDIHSPERKDAVVRALADPGRFSEPVALATTPFNQPSTEYKGLVKALNERRVSTALAGKFAEHDHTVATGARVLIKMRSSVWRIDDTITHQGKRHQVQYEVAEEVTGAGDSRKATLTASARIASAFSPRERFPIQLFFYHSENDQWHGRLFDLAAYAEPSGPAAEEQRFKAVVELLRNRQPSGGGISLKALLEEKGELALPSDPVIQAGAATDGPWILEAGDRYRVKIEHPRTTTGEKGHVLAVFLHLDAAARNRRELELMAFIGQDPDAPGTELAAYFDRFTIEELMQVIDHLRSPYRDWHSIYIHQAQLAIARKKDYFQWWQAQYGEIALAQPLFDQPYAELGLSESDDKNALVYAFRFNEIWQEVKASHPKLGSFQTDLFTEEDLWRKLRRTDDINDRGEGDELAIESPFGDLETLRQEEMQGLERYEQAEKYVLDPLPGQDPSDCAELAIAVERWKTLASGGTDPDEIKRIMGMEKTASGKTLWDHLAWLYDGFQTLMLGDDLKDIAFQGDSLLVTLVEKIPRFAPTAWGVPTVAGALLRVWPAVSIPLAMWQKFLDAQMQALKAEENRGKLTAIRQYLRALKTWTFTSDFPDDLDIQLDPSKAVAYYFDQRVYDYRDHFQWIFDAEALEKGFKAGLKLMAKAGPAIVDGADELMAAIFREFDANDCRLKVLRDAGLIDIGRLKAEIVRATVDALLDQVPKVG